MKNTTPSGKNGAATSVYKRLDPSAPPSGNFDLQCWTLTLPVNESGELSGELDAMEVKEEELSNGFVNEDYFYTAEGGGMVFRSPVFGATTSLNTKYTRTELREMLRCGNTDISTSGVGENNWVLSSAPKVDQEAAGGIDGTLEATLAVNVVTSTGDSDEVGRVIIGQIHANPDEPVRIYYRKLPNNEKGAVYFAHEWNSGVEENEEWFDLIGSREDSANNPENGIALNELFSYRIQARGNELTVTISRDGHEDTSATVNMGDSGYDVGGQALYFKAGVYNQNVSGDPDDYVQATFYSLERSHP